MKIVYTLSPRVWRANYRARRLLPQHAIVAAPAARAARIGIDA